MCAEPAAQRSWHQVLDRRRQCPNLGDAHDAAAPTTSIPPRAGTAQPCAQTLPFVLKLSLRRAPQRAVLFPDTCLLPKEGPPPTLTRCRAGLVAQLDVHRADTLSPATVSPRVALMPEHNGSRDPPAGYVAGGRAAPIGSRLAGDGVGGATSTRSSVASCGGHSLYPQSHG